MAQAALGVGERQAQAPARTHSHPPLTSDGSEADQALRITSDISLGSSSSSSSLPKFSRSFTMPTPSQLGHLQRPQSPGVRSPSKSSDQLAAELADSVQMVIQTLLQISPPQLLDPAKEQLSGCALQVPTPSISALFTSMKMLNYMSKHISTFNASDPRSSPPTLEDDFDVGELLQNVGDALSGVAAEAGVDLVIFHADSSLKNLQIKTDECGLIYSLSYMARQILSVASRGDVLEIGLRLAPDSTSSARLPAIPGTKEPLLCTFEFKHKSPQYTVTDSEEDSVRQPSSQSPNLQTPALFTLLRCIRAEIVSPPPSQSAALKARYDLLVHVRRGSKGSTISISPEEEAVRQPFPGLNLAREPSMSELLEFAKTLKGRKATFHASTRSSFAHYLTSYLTGWGMDVTHVPTDSGLSTPPSGDDPTPEPHTGQEITVNTEKMGAPDEPTKLLNSTKNMSSGPPFTIIDDDVEVLKTALAEFEHPLQLPSDMRFKRPSLADHHRPRSFFVRRAIGVSSSAEKLLITSVFLYFTSLSNYREVKDVVQAIASPKRDRAPEIIVIPKPVGVRRFLTALYTATTKPYVDPVFFSPIATSPMSPNGRPFTPFSTQPAQSPRAVVTPPTSSGTSVPDMSTTPFSSGEPTPIQSLTTSPLGTGGYFEREGNRIAGSASSGLFVKSPDGRTGIFFQPFAPYEDSTSTVRYTPTDSIDAFVAESAAIQARALIGDSPFVLEAHIGNRNQILEQDQARAAPFPAGSLHPSPPIMPSSLGNPLGDGIAANPVFERGPAAVKPSKPVKASIVGAKVKKQAEVVPPISVLIVEDNAIQRTILSTFMKNKHISYAVAENGEEAVEKWGKGNYHLVLMDIQMPIMDGIQATKKIREIEGVRHRTLTSFTPLSEGPLTPNSVTSGETRHPSTPFHSSVIIVALTAQSSTQDRVAALAAGCNDFLSKPVKLQWLERKIIEWGSIKALQMWADPEVEPLLHKRQQASAQAIADNLHIGRLAKSPSGR